MDARQHETRQSGVNRPSAESAGAGALSIEEHLRRGGLHAALAHLNAHTRFRFTGVYRVESDLLRTVALFDRENPSLASTADVVKLEETYCGVTCRGAPFQTANAQRDERLRHHAARDTVLSYVGVPVHGANDAVWGTLCHFDHRPRVVAPGDVAALKAAAPAIARWLAGAAVSDAEVRAPPNG
jgi:GAF domain-containing protein